MRILFVAALIAPVDRLERVSERLTPVQRRQHEKTIQCCSDFSSHKRMHWMTVIPLWRLSWEQGSVTTSGTRL
jgi:hypothetical protein